MKLPEPDRRIAEDDPMYGVIGADYYKADTVLRLIAEERERCARICEQSDDDGEGPDSWGWRSKDYAKAIRKEGGA